MRRAAVYFAALTLTLLTTACGSGVSVQVGAPAPDITLTGATRDGVLPEPVTLSDFRGQTVVLAYFFRARTPG